MSAEQVATAEAYLRWRNREMTKAQTADRTTGGGNVVESWSADGYR